MEKDENCGRFSITVDYDKKSPNPENIFIGIAKLIESFKAMDSELITCVDTNIETEMLLEDVEKGSVKVWLSNRLKSISDDDIADLNYKRVIGGFLVDAKYYVLRKCSDIDEIKDVEVVEEIETGIKEIAQKTGLNQLGCYTSPPRERLLRGLNKVGEAFVALEGNNSVSMSNSQGQILTLNKNFRLPLQSLDELCEGENIDNTTTVILKVRKPDFLGETSWIFKHGHEEIKAKITDENWLNRYLKGQEPIVPGDSLKVRLNSVATYDKNQNLTKTKHTVIEVLSVVHAENTPQTELLQ